MVGAHIAAGKTTVFEWAGVVAVAVWVSAVVYFNRSSAREMLKARQKRDVRNAYLNQEIKRIDATKVSPEPEEDRELTLAELRRLQLIFDVGSQAIDDFSNFTIVDQFQPAAIRYQLYEMMYCLGMYQGIYALNFHWILQRSFLQNDRKVADRTSNVILEMGKPLG